MPVLTEADACALILFSTPPTDRALSGWCGGRQVADLLEELRMADTATAKREAAA